MSGGEDRRLVYYPDSRLRAVCRAVEPGSPGLVELTEAMADLMRRYNGVGLAAPQVGDDRRIVVINAPGYASDHGRRVMLNPVIESLSDDREPFEEGCLSFPRIYHDVMRPGAVRVAYQDLDGASCSLEDDGMLARIVQHEIDHLDGVLFIDHLSPWRRTEVDLRMRLRFRCN